MPRARRCAARSCPDHHRAWRRRSSGAHATLSPSAAPGIAGPAWSGPSPSGAGVARGSAMMRPRRSVYRGSAPRTQPPECPRARPSAPSMVAGTSRPPVEVGTRNQLPRQGNDAPKTRLASVRATESRRDEHADALQARGCTACSACSSSSPAGQRRDGASWDIGCRRGATRVALIPATGRPVRSSRAGRWQHPPGAAAVAHVSGRPGQAQHRSNRPRTRQ